MQRSQVIDITKSFLPVDPESFVQNLVNTDREDGEEKTLPIVPYDGYNFIPTNYGYRAFFGTNAKLNAGALSSRCQFILSFQTSEFKIILIALAEDGIWTLDTSTADAIWTHDVIHTFDANIFEEWTWCVIEGDLYCYKQGYSVVYRTGETTGIAGQAPGDYVTISIVAHGTPATDYHFYAAIINSDFTLRGEKTDLGVVSIDEGSYTTFNITSGLPAFDGQDPCYLVIYGVRVSDSNTTYNLWLNTSTSANFGWPNTAAFDFADAADVLDLPNPGIQLTFTELTPNFSAPEAKLGIFKAGNRLGFWDAQNSVFWSNGVDFTDFVPAIETGAGARSFGDVVGRIVTIKSHGTGFIIYATKSIVGVIYSESDQLIWTGRKIADNTGISHSRAVTCGQSDTEQFAWTTSGIYTIGKYNAISGNHEAQVVLPEIWDLYKEPRLPVYLDILNSRYLVFQFFTDTYLLGASYFELFIMDGHKTTMVLNEGYWDGTLGDLPTTIDGNTIVNVIKQIAEGNVIWNSLVTKHDASWWPYWEGTYDRLTDESIANPVLYPVDFTLLGNEFLFAIWEQEREWWYYEDQQQTLIANRNAGPIYGEWEDVGSPITSGTEPTPPADEVLSAEYVYIETGRGPVLSISEPGYFIHRKYFVERETYFTYNTKEYRYIPAGGYTYEVERIATNFDNEAGIGYIYSADGSHYVSYPFYNLALEYITNFINTSGIVHNLFKIWGSPGFATDYATVFDWFATEYPTDLDTASMSLGYVKWNPAPNLFDPEETNAIYVSMTLVPTIINSDTEDKDTAIVTFYLNPVYISGNNGTHIEVKFAITRTFTESATPDQWQLQSRIYQDDEYHITETGDYGYSQLEAIHTKYQLIETNTDNVIQEVTTGYALSNPAIFSDMYIDWVELSHNEWYGIRRIINGDGYVIEAGNPFNLTQGYIGTLTTSLTYEAIPTATPITEIDGYPLEGAYHPPITLDIEYPATSLLIQTGSPLLGYNEIKGALLYDIHLKKWGKYILNYYNLIDLVPINSDLNVGVSHTNLGIDAAFQLYDATDVRNHIIVQDANPTTGFIQYGKIGLSRFNFTDLHEVRIYFRKAFTGTIIVEGSLNGRDVSPNIRHTESFEAVTEAILYTNLSALWYNLIISGNYDLTGVEVRANISSRR